MLTRAEDSLKIVMRPNGRVVAAGAGSRRRTRGRPAGLCPSGRSDSRVWEGTMFEALREEVCAMNLDLPANGLVVWSGGNVSGRDRETGCVVIKPSGVKFDRLTPESMVVVDPSGAGHGG